MPFSQDGSRKSGHPMRIIVVVVNRPGSSIHPPHLPCPPFFHEPSTICVCPSSCSLRVCLSHFLL
jgi:hypothetical protein